MVIRCYRKLGIDLQKEVHEDMRSHFDLFPKKWGLKKPNTNIDHRRVPNLQVFFSRHGIVLPVTKNAQDYQPGDLVTWGVYTRPHIGIVVDRSIDAMASDSKWSTISALAQSSRTCFSTTT